MISQRSIQEVLDTAKVEDVVGDFVNLKRRGANLLGLCPFHNEKTPSFTVSPTKNIYKCFGCGKGGNAVQFLMEHESFTFPEAIRHLAERYGIELEETQTSDEAREEKQLADSLYIVNDYARAFYEDQLFNTDRGKSVGLSYFKKRGFNEATIRKFGLGFAPEKRDAFTLKAVQDGHNIELLRKLGLVSKYDNDFFRDRVMFTIHNLSGKVVAFAGRILQKDVKAPKYINSPETEIYNKSKTLYGAYFAKKAIRQEDECILVEGYTDVISLHQAGIENVVASSGTSLTEGQIQVIKRYTNNIKIIYDGDAAGEKAADRGLNMLLEEGLNVNIILLPMSEDPDSFLGKVGAEKFKEYLIKESKDLILYRADSLLKKVENNPLEKANVVKEIIESIGLVVDPVKRESYTKQLKNILDVDEHLAVREINKVVKRQFERRKLKKGKLELDQKSDEKSLSDDFIGDEFYSDVNEKDLLKETQLGDAFQEKDIVRILITAGSELYDEAKEISVAKYILGNIEDVIEEFDNKLYQKVVKTALDRFLAKEPVSQQFFLQNPDPEIAKLAIDVLASPYEFSENWGKRWDIFLNQKAPEENFLKDSLQALQRFKLRKIMRMCDKNLQRIDELTRSGATDKLVAHLKVQQKLTQMRNDLANKLGTVVLK